MFYFSKTPVFFNCYSVTNRQKTAFFDNFGLTQPFFNNFHPISPKWENIKVISPFQRRFSKEIFSVYDILGLFCFVVHPELFLKENMSSPAGLSKTFSLFLQKYLLWPFPDTEVQLQSRFIQPRRNFLNNFEEICWEHCAKRRVVCFSRPVSCACRHFPKSVILASGVPAVRPFVAYYAGFLTAFWYVILFHNCGFFSNCYSVTSRQETAFFWRFWANSGVFYYFPPPFPKLRKYSSHFTVSETLFRANLLRLQHFETFLFRGSSRMVFKRKEELSRWSQQSVFLFLAKVPFVAIFGYRGPTSESIYST